METKIKLNGYDFSTTEKKFVKKVLQYNEPDSTKAYAHGAPSSINGAKLLIKNYYEQIKTEMGKEAVNENIAFTFGKDALLAILSQENCVGIKFYIGKRIETERPVDFVGKWAGKTLVAVGTRNDKGETEIGAEVDYLARGIDDPTSTNTKGDDDTEPGLVMEMVPPFTVADIPPKP